MVYDYDKLREYVRRCKWQWATSMIDVPHEYIHRDKCALTREEFYYFVGAQRQNGIHEKWGNYNFPYLYLDGYKYWTMGDPFATTWILNRQKVFNEFDFLEWPLPRTYDRPEMEMMANTIMKTFAGRKIFECGFGNGDFVKYSKVLPENYYGVDPAKKAVQQFRKETTGYYRRCSTISFEEAIKKWLSADSVVIALWGAPSYFMEQYLKKLNESLLDYCLMFYQDGYTPEPFKEMHHFGYNLKKIKSLFPMANVYKGQHYITISSKRLQWQQPSSEYELFKE